MFDFAYARQIMVDRHLIARGISDERVLQAMAAVPRENFVAPDTAELAYHDTPLGIGEGQTISQPYVVALMAEAARIEPDDRVLEVGAGSGYAAAVLAHLARDVLAIERHRVLGGKAQQRLEGLGYRNVEIIIGDGSQGCAGHAPFDAIIVSAGTAEIPEALKDQLKPGGRLIIPVGPSGQIQRLKRITRIAVQTYEEEDLGGVQFVPLVGKKVTVED